MPWDANKFGPPHPTGFTNADALNLITNANWAAAIFVNISAFNQGTKQAYIQVPWNDANGVAWTITLVAHTHPPANWTTPGNCFIPGWQGWSAPTPVLVANAIGPLAQGGAFPANRYPH
jgi:hypothetical protein